MIREAPMAWLILRHDRRRLLLSAAGIGFAVLLVFVEIGVRNAMFDSQVLLIEKLDADLIIANDRKFSLVFHEPFARRRLEQVRAVPGVRTADPVYTEFDTALLKNPSDGSIQPIRVVAFDPARCVFRDLEICRQTERLKQDETALYDRKSRSFFGLKANEVTELGHRTIRFVGSFTMGTDFAHDGNLIMSDTSFFRYFASARAPNELPARVELGVVTVEQSATEPCCPPMCAS
jgi:putative ABC transport system permease protein